MIIIMYVLITALVFVLTLPWIFILGAPLLALGLSLTIGANLLLKEGQIRLASLVNKNKFTEFLTSKLIINNEPIKVCSCLKEKNGHFYLTARFITKNGEWSHHVKGVSFDDAVHRISSQIERRDNTVNLSCLNGTRPCANIGSCPNRFVKKPSNLLYSYDFSDKIDLFKNGRQILTSLFALKIFH